MLLRCYQSKVEPPAGVVYLNDFTLSECYPEECGLRNAAEACTHCMKVVGLEGFLLQCYNQAAIDDLGLVENGCMNANATKLGPMDRTNGLRPIRTKLGQILETFEEAHGLHVTQICTCTEDACNHP